MAGNVWRSIYSKQLSRGQHRYGADVPWGVLDGTKRRPCNMPISMEGDISKAIQRIQNNMLVTGIGTGSISSIRETEAGDGTYLRHVNQSVGALM